MMMTGIALSIFLIVIFLIKHYFPYFFKAFRLTILRGHWTATPYDMKDFPYRTIPAENPLQWPLASDYNTSDINESFADSMQKMKTRAFLVACNGELVHESYFGSHNRQTISNSFSMAKTIVTLLVRKAVEEGYLDHLDQRITDFFPGYNYDPANQLTIRDLLRMSSGMDWRENYYLPFNETTDAYYGERLSELILSRKIITMPGTHFNYQSGNTQLLGMVLDKILPGSLSNYLSHKFWSPLQMEHDAYWTIDRPSGIEKAYCCIHATSRDFLKFGQLFLQNGEWDGEQLIDSYFIEEMRTPGFSSSPQYGEGLWLDGSYNPPFYLMRGHLGQYVIVIPSEQVVICRLGQKYMKDDNPPRLQLEDIYMYVEGALKLVNG